MEYGIHAEYFTILERARKVYARFLEPVCRRWKLTRNEVDVLLFLHNNPGFDRAADIVSRRGIAKSHVSLAVTGLEAAGLLEKHRVPDDRRTLRLILTERGLQAAGEARVQQQTFFQSLYQSVSREALDAQAAVSCQVWRNLETMEETREN